MVWAKKKYAFYCQTVVINMKYELKSVNDGTECNENVRAKSSIETKSKYIQWIWVLNEYSCKYNVMVEMRRCLIKRDVPFKSITFQCHKFTKTIRFTTMMDHWWLRKIWFRNRSCFFLQNVHHQVLIIETSY